MKSGFNIKKYEIYTCNFGNNPGSVQSGVHPVLIIQDDRLNRFSPTTVVAPITSVLKKKHLPSHLIIGKKYGLRKPSMVLFEQIRTVNQYELDKYIGIINDEKTRKKARNACMKTIIV